jgi:plastocyanin
MSHRPTRIPLLIPVGIAVLLGGCSDSSSSNNPPATADVAIVANAQTKTFTAYAPDTFSVTLASGGKVIFRNDDAVTHTATGDADSASFYTGNLAAGAVDTVTFTTSGSHPFHCTIHPGMVGLIIVNP